MTLQHLEMGFCFKLSLTGFGMTFIANAIKNTVANTIQKQLEAVGSITVSNYGTIKKEVGVHTRCMFFTHLVFALSLIELGNFGILYYYSTLNQVSNWLLVSTEAIVAVLYGICTCMAMCSVIVVFLSPRQNLLSRNWNI